MNYIISSAWHQNQHGANWVRKVCEQDEHHSQCAYIDNCCSVSGSVLWAAKMTPSFQWALNKTTSCDCWLWREFRGWWWRSAASIHPTNNHIQHSSFDFQIVFVKMSEYTLISASSQRRVYCWTIDWVKRKHSRGLFLFTANTTTYCVAWKHQFIQLLHTHTHTHTHTQLELFWAQSCSSSTYIQYIHSYIFMIHTELQIIHTHKAERSQSFTFTHMARSSEMCVWCLMEAV